MKVVIIGTGLVTNVPAAAGTALPSPGTWELVLRLLLAGLLGTLIGAEREYRAKVAGMRTHLLVALGAALMMIVSQYGFGGHGDPSRVAAQIVSGIGFIGADAIMVNKHAVHGVTTAAGLWVSAGIGMAVASGLYGLSVATTLFALVGLEAFGRIIHKLRGKGSHTTLPDEN